MARQLRVKYPGTLSHRTARGNDQPTIVPDETDQTDFLTRLGQEGLPQRWAVQSQAMTPSVFWQL